jgi:hypothetical protein
LFRHGGTWDLSLGPDAQTRKTAPLRITGDSRSEHPMKRSGVRRQLKVLLYIFSYLFGNVLSGFATRDIVAMTF